MLCIYKTDIKYTPTRPPLPFVGNKGLWFAHISPIIMQLPVGIKVFDVFGGSMITARYIKDLRNDLEVYTTDYNFQYKHRLSCVDVTNAILERMRRAGAYGVCGKYVKYEQQTEKAIKSVIDECEREFGFYFDKETVYRNFYVAGKRTPRAKCRTVDYDDVLCKNWLNGLTVKNIKLTESTETDYDLYVLDPPYKTTPKGWLTKGDYSGDSNGARRFCEKIITSGKNYILFDEPESDLVLMVKQKGAVEITKNRDRQHAHEVMLHSVNFS